MAQNPVQPAWPSPDIHAVDQGLIGVPWRTARAMTQEQREYIIHHQLGACFYILTQQEAARYLREPHAAIGRVHHFMHRRENPLEGDTGYIRFWLMLGRKWDERTQTHFNVWWCCDVRQTYIAAAGHMTQP